MLRYPAYKEAMGAIFRGRPKRLARRGWEDFGDRDIGKRRADMIDWHENGSKEAS